jgi:hypothetical protein
MPTVSAISKYPGGKTVTIPLPAEADAVSPRELRRLTNVMVDGVQRLLRGCTDADVTFVPVDPLADDPAAEPGHEQNVAWTLGHIIVHTTATAEESAALAAELARGVPYHGRSRREVPWQEVTTLDQCRARLEESRRMCVASLGMWPDQPDLANSYIPWEDGPVMGAVARYLLGLRHEADHLEQIRDVIGQARAARRGKTRLGRWRR